jgi:hypothetical protein
MADSIPYLVPTQFQESIFPPITSPKIPAHDLDESREPKKNTLAIEKIIAFLSASYKTNATIVFTVFLYRKFLFKVKAFQDYNLFFVATSPFEI